MLGSKSSLFKKQNSIEKTEVGGDELYRQSPTKIRSFEESFDLAKLLFFLAF
jgi:hypothetical protein